MWGSMWYSPRLPLDTWLLPPSNHARYAAAMSRSQCIFSTLHVPRWLTPPCLLQTLTDPTRLNSRLISSSEDFYDTNPPPVATATHQEWQPERTHFRFTLPQCMAHSPEVCWEWGVSNRSAWMPTQRACLKLSEFHHNPGYGPYVTQFHQWQAMLLRLEKLNHTH